MSDRPWLQNYPVRPKLKYPEISLYQFIEDTCTHYPDLISLVFMGNEVTYREMFENINRTASVLTDLGVKKGDKVGLMLPNCPQYVYLYYACMKLGAIVVQMNPMYMPNEVEFILSDSQAKVYAGLDAVFNNFHQVRNSVPVEHAIVVRMFYVPVEGENLYYDELMKKALEDVDAAEILPKEDVAVFQYTGGTTGFPKAVMLTHFNLVANVIQIWEWLSPWYMERYGITDLEGDLWAPENRKKYRDKMIQSYGIGILPLFHSYGMTCVMNYGLSLPSGQVLMPRMDVDALLMLIKQYRPAAFPAVPTIYTAIANHPDAEKYDIDAIEICNSGAAPMPVEVMERFEQRTGAKMMEGFGLSESSPVTHCNPCVGVRKPGSVGMPYPDTDSKIVDLETGTQEMPVGAEGELIIKGPQVMKGYWNRTEETEKTLRDGWLYTGDIAKMDEDGYFFIVDRKKDMVITGGYNVYPREVDEVLFEHPKIAEAVAAGIPDDYYGEVIKAYIVLKEGAAATAEEILEYCAKKLAKYKVPRMVEFRDSLPKSTVGKILRRALVEEEKKKKMA